MINQNIQEFLSYTPSYVKNLNKLISQCDKKMQDILHKIELENVEEPKVIIGLIKDVREIRRFAKTEQSKAQLISAMTKTITNRVGKVGKNKKYTNRMGKVI